MATVTEVVIGLSKQLVPTNMKVYEYKLVVHQTRFKHVAVYTNKDCEYFFALAIGGYNKNNTWLIDYTNVELSPAGISTEKFAKAMLDLIEKKALFIPDKESTESD